MRHVTILSVAALALGSGAVAHPSPTYDVRPSFNRCIDSSSGVTVVVLNCIGAEYDFQDAVLNARYKGLSARLNPKQRTVLRASQRRWLKGREAACAKDAGVGDGTLADVTRNQCMLGNLVARIDWLNRYRP